MGTFSEADLIEAILTAQATSANPPGAVTVRELIAQTGMTEKRVVKRLRQLADEQRLECVSKSSTSLDGRNVRVPAYRLKAGST